MATGSNGGESYGLYFNPSAQATTSITGTGDQWGTITIENQPRLRIYVQTDAV
jgi:hypothetical protein